MVELLRMSTVAPTFLPEHFINRELSWLEFNARVLEEAEDANNPLLERVKFLAIFASNLDEFFMVRVAGLREQAFDEMLPQDPPADGLKPIAQLQRIARRTEQLVAQQYGVWNESIVPALAEAGIRIHTMKDLDAKGVKSLDKYLPPGNLSRAHADGDRPEPSQPALSQSRVVPRRDAGAGERHRAVAAVCGGAGTAGVAAVRVGGAGRQAELRDAGRSDRQPAAGLVRRLQDCRSRERFG